MKTKASKLDQYAERLDEMFSAVADGGKGYTLAQAREELRQDGCSVSASRLSSWWAARQQATMHSTLLAQIASGARACREVEAQFGANPAPELETIIKLQRVLILKLSTQANVDPSLIKLVVTLSQPALEYARLQTKRVDQERQEKELNLALTKYRDQVAEHKRTLEALTSKAKVAGGLTPETLEKIEAELRLL